MSFTRMENDKRQRISECHVQPVTFPWLGAPAVGSSQRREVKVVIPSTLRKNQFVAHRSNGLKPQLVSTNVLAAPAGCQHPTLPHPFGKSSNTPLLSERCRAPMSRHAWATGGHQAAPPSRRPVKGGYLAGHLWSQMVSQQELVDEKELLR